MTGILAPVGLLALATAAVVGASRSRRALLVPAALLAGLLIGPHGTRLVPDPEALQGASQLGLAVLLFTTGLLVNPQRLRQGGRMAVPLAAYDLVLSMAAAAWIGHVFQWPATERVLLAGAFATASTATVLRLVADAQAGGSRIVGTLAAMVWIEDLAFGAFWIFVAGRAHVIEDGFGLTTALRLGAFAGYLALLRLGRDRLWRIRSVEVKALVAMGLGLVGAWLGTPSGLPQAGAAFTTGLVLSGGRGARFSEREAPVLGHASAALVFIGFGALLDPTEAADALPATALALAALLAVKLLLVPQAGRLLGLRTNEAHALGAALLARGGKSATFVRLENPAAGAAPVAAIVAVLTLILTPISPWIARRLLLRRGPLAPPSPMRRREWISHQNRNFLAPGPFARNARLPWHEAVNFAGGFVLAFELGVLASLLPYAWRIPVAAVGFLAALQAYRYAETVLRRRGSPARDRSAAIRIHDVLPGLLVGPCLLVLALPLLLPWATVAYPTAFAGLLLFMVLLPRIAPGPPRARQLRSPRAHARPPPPPVRAPVGQTRPVVRLSFARPGSA